jgi:MFS family permease
MWRFRGSSRDLGITSTDAQWVQDTYTLVFAALLLVAGRLADRVGAG